MLLCIDLKKNTLLWNKVLIPSKNFTGLNVIKFSDVVIENNYAYILSNFSNFIKVDINSGNIIWSIPLNSNHRPLVSINNIVFVDETNNIIIVDKISGKLFFKKNLNFKNQKNKIEINSLFFISNSIHIFGNDGSLFKIEVSNLSDIKYEKLPNAINSNIAISSNDLFFIGNKNKIFKTR